MELFKKGLFEGKTVPVTQQQVLQAWRKVKAAKGGGGVDGKTIQMVEAGLGNELYKLWNRMASGCYFPQPVKAVSIPKRDGTQRWLGIPTVLDRVAQQIVKSLLEPQMEKVFHQDSFGYRPAKGTMQAIAQCNKRCARQPWVVDIDIKGFFDNISHELLLKALDRHNSQKWVVLYITRWLKAPVEKAPAEKQPIVKQTGTPQGGVISPLLANLFLHYAFDMWFDKRFPQACFERYADDIIIHCDSRQAAHEILGEVKARMQQCRLQAHPDKTKVVYCKNYKRAGKYKQVAFDFLGFCFQPRKIKTQYGYNLGFGPAISTKAKKHITLELKKKKVHRRTHLELQQLAHELKPKIIGWVNYFGKHRKWAMYPVFRSLNDRLVKWLMNKYKRYKNKVKVARTKLKAIASAYPNLFLHWRYGFIPG